MVPGAGDDALRAPLQGLIGALDLLAEATDEAERRDWLALARACADELAGILENGTASQRTSRRLSILVADDVETNRVVVAAMLERAGHRVAFAGDGAAAVAAAARGGYDTILLDIEMPELDGLSAAKAIRALPGANGRVTLIGLSAHAAPEDRARSLASGLDEHLGKPIDRASLLACLERLVPRDTAPALDAAMLAQLRNDVGAEEYAALLVGYRDEILRGLAAIGAGEALDDPIGLAREAHILKASAGAVGATALAATAAALDTALRRNGDVAACRDALLAEHAATASALDAAIKQSAAG
jgi:CheY-like chemotaxis protein/HPt (histidine-containing phosphotransfer) domain-containing protein